MAKLKIDLTSRKFWKKLASVVIASLMFAATVFAVVAITKKIKDETEKIYPSWSIGVLDESTGKVDKDKKTSIFTTDPFDAKGLEVILDFANNITYQVFWYDKEGVFLEVTDELSVSSTFKAPAYAQAIVEITPLTISDGKDEIKWYDTYTYSKQLEIRVAKNQELKASAFTSIRLSDTDFFIAQTGWYSVLKNEIIVDGKTHYTSYFYENTDGEFSAVYLEKNAVVNGNNLFVRLIDGTVIRYYSLLANENGDATSSEAKSIPTRAEDAIYLPKGSTLIFIGIFGEDGAENTILRFY